MSAIVSDAFSLYLSVTTVGFLVAIWAFRRAQGHVYCRIPGPRGLPFIGTLDFPRERHWETYRDWSREYGSDIIGVKALGTNIVILNSYESAIELLEKRSLIYSDRPASGFTMLSDLCGMGRMFPFKSYGQELRDGRKVFSREFNAGAVKKWRMHECKATLQFLSCLLKDPDRFISHTKTMAGGLILSIAYGVEVQDEYDPLLTEAQVATHVVAATLVPGAYLVDLFPLLRFVPEWFPGATFKKQARLWKRSVTYSLTKPWEMVKDKMARNPDKVPACVTSSILADIVEPAKDPAYMEDVARAAIGSMHLAGSDTIISATLTFFLAMNLHPEVQKRAQASVDVVLQGRLPNFSDWDSLPYVHAIVKECLRWHPIACINLAHTSSRDDVYRQYSIPKGTIVLANNWAMLHDPKTYPDPETFTPERFLMPTTGGRDTEVRLDVNAPDPANIAFGFGRRICPGRFMGYESLWIIIASVLATLNVSKTLDRDGHEIIPEEKYESTFIVTPEPFVCKITARAAAHKRLVQEALNQGL